MGVWSDGERQRIEGLMGRADHAMFQEGALGKAQFYFSEIQKILSAKLPLPDESVRPQVRGPIGADGQPPKSQRGKGNGTKKTAKKRTR